MRKNYLFIIPLAFLLACDYLSGLRSSGTSDAEQPVARVHDRVLYKKDLAGLVAQRTGSADSSNIVNRYIESWVKKQLLMHIASENAQMDEAEINRRIEDYRYDLTVYAYEKQYMQQHLDTVITEAQIAEYYEENKGNFELKQNIVKAISIVVPKNSPKLSQVRKFIDEKDDLEKLKEIAPNVATNYYLSDTAWIDFEELILNTPFMEELSNKMEVLRRNRLLEASDENNFYFIKVYDYKLSSDMSPLSFVKDRIRDVILNRRRVELRRKHENEILKQAEKDNDYEIFKNPGQ